MLLRTLVRAWVLAVLVPAGAMALGLGDIHLKSTLNAPLDAEIDLVGAAPEDLQGLKATIASRDSFLRYGLDYPAFVGGVKLQTGKSADGRDVIQLHSADPITEPFATLLVEVNWARGHLLHEYTVLLDPPVFATQGPSTAAAVAAPVVGDTTRSGAVERPAATPPAAAAPTVAPSASAPAASAAAGTYHVRSGDTLSSIAATHYRQSERASALVAIYRSNTHAFAGNMNVLRSGAELTLPAESDVSAVGPADANAEVSSQYRTWAKNRPSAAGSGQLRLVPPSAAPAAGAMPGAVAASGGPGKGAATDSAALQHQIGQLQSDLAASQRLLELKNAELAKLQQQLGAAGHPAAPAAAPPAVAAPPVAAAPNPAPSNPVAPAAETKKPVVPAAKTAPAAPSGGGLLDWLLSYWYLPVGALALIAAALGWRAMRSRQDVSFDRSLDQLARQADARAARPADSHTQTQPIRTLTAPKDTSFLVEESGPHERPKVAADETDQLSTSQIMPLEGTMPTEAVALDQGDPLAEADFHMAYGLYDQAADLIKIAITREPERRDLRLKLLEVYFVWGNKEQFLQLARELAASRDKTLPGEWEKVIIMGRQIAADDPLFGESGALPGAASAGVDLNLEGGQNRVDFDLLGEPSMHRESAEGVDLDLGAALGDKEATAESATLRDAGVDFVLDDPARGGDQTGSTREMPQSAGSAHTVTLEMDKLALPRSAADSPTVEQPAVAGHGSVQERLEAAMGGATGGGDRTAELAIDDLGLDLHGAEHLDVGATGMHEAPTMRANLDEETRNLMQAGTPGAQEDNATLSAPTASGTWLFTDAELSTVLPSMKGGAEAPTELVTQIMPAGSQDPASTDRLVALKADPGALDIDLGSTGMMPKIVLDKDANGSGLDLDVGHQVTSPSGNTARLSGLDLDVGGRQAESGDTTSTRRLDKGDMVLPDLEPATLSEVGTKLDLARAYMDMGDPDGARNILEEVLSEGSVSQKQEARRLIDSLPG
ncbi:MAG TPA: FimV/HubP family polar landmark protein [Steroidobacteraceae bacterium]